MEIAKLRALRMLFAQLTESFGITEEQTLRIHVRTAQWNKLEQDAYNNMIRATIEAMAAVLGGCDALTIDPYNTFSSQHDPFGHRIARNVSLILKEESHFDKVANIADGSFYLESLTHSLAHEAWKLFGEVEKRGGMLKAFRAKFVQEEIEKVSTAKEGAIRDAKQVLVGFNKYQAKGETGSDKAIFSKLARHL